MLTLKNIVKTDYDDIKHLTNQKSVMQYIGNGQTWSNDKIHKFIKYNQEEQKQSDSHRQNYYYKIINQNNNNFIGIVGFHMMNTNNPKNMSTRYHKFYLTIYFEPIHQGKGYYSNVIKLIKEKMNKHQPNHNILYSLTHNDNVVMNMISRKKYNFLRQTRLGDTILNEYAIPVDTYKCLMESEYYKRNDFLKLVEKRDNWKLIRLDEINKTSIDFIYMDGIFINNKQIQSVSSSIKNIVDDVKKQINEKNSIYKNLLKHNDRKIITKYLLPQYNIDLVHIKEHLENTEHPDSIIDKYYNLFNQYNQPDENVWIFKPVGGWSGKGIRIFNCYHHFILYCEEIIKENKHKWKNINTKQHKHKLSLQNEWVLQKYITNPMLFQNKKFHIRCYYLYTYINNKPQGYIYSKGNIYTAKDNYEPDLSKDCMNLDNKDIHDTHLASTMDDYIFPEDLLIKNELNDYILKQIIDLTQHVYDIVKPKCYPENEHCYELFGIDVMITEEHRVKLLEINSKVGLKYIKNNAFFVKLLDDVLNLTIDKVYPSKSYNIDDNLFIPLFNQKHKSHNVNRKIRKTKKTRKTNKKQEKLIKKQKNITRKHNKKRN